MFSQGLKCLEPLDVLDEIWRPLPLIYRLKKKSDGPLQTLELDQNKSHNVIAKLTYDITLSCPMDFVKFPFDQQDCIFEMILDEGLNGNVTIYTHHVMFTMDLVKQDFTPSEFSYDYKVYKNIVYNSTGKGPAQPFSWTLGHFHSNWMILISNSILQPKLAVPRKPIT